MKTMGISNGNVQAKQAGMSQTMDSESSNIQKQIDEAKKQLQELSSNKELSDEEKMKKRQEIQKQISDLNIQLRQHQMELRKEKQQPKEPSKSETAKTGVQEAGLSQGSMWGILAADSSLNQAQIQGSAANKMERKADILKVEIKQDAALGGNTEAKEKELSEVEKRAADTTDLQMRTLGEAGRKMEESAKSESDDKTETKNESETKEKTKEKMGYEQPVNDYTPVDVRL